MCVYIKLALIILYIYNIWKEVLLLWLHNIIQ